jgi:ribosomal protein L15
MPQVTDYSVLTNFLFWGSVVLSIAVLAQLIYFIVLSTRVLQRRSAEKTPQKRVANAPNVQKHFVSLLPILPLAAAVVPLDRFSSPLLVLFLLLLADCGLLIYANTYLKGEIKKPLQVSAPAPKPKPEPKPEPKIIEPAIPAGPSAEEEKLVAELVRETITIEEAHNAIDDAVAVHFVEIEKSAGDKNYQKKEIINIDTLSESFAPGDTVSLESLRAKGLISEKTDCYKVLARGMLDKALIVEAQDFSADAIKMIILTGGHAVKKS